MNALAADAYTADPVGSAARLKNHPRLDWVVVGGESGADARPFDVEWSRDTMTQCQEAKVPFFLKQFGRRPTILGVEVVWDFTWRRWTEGRFKDSHGGNWDEWPEGFKVRQFPQARV